MRMALMLPNQPHLLFLDPGLGKKTMASQQALTQKRKDRPQAVSMAHSPLRLLLVMVGARDTADGPREGSPNPWESNPMKWYAEAGFSVASQVGRQWTGSGRHT